jgi:hypothetical protein
MLYAALLVLTTWCLELLFSLFSRPQLSILALKQARGVFPYDCPVIGRT